jgi:hypothetical protein
VPEALTPLQKFWNSGNELFSVTDFQFQNESVTFESDSHDDLALRSDQRLEQSHHHQTGGGPKSWQNVTKMAKPAFYFL